MPDSDQILDKYAQLKLDLKLKEEEKQRKIQEELDAKNPLKQYEKIQKELADSKKKFAKEIEENNKKVEEEKKKQVEASQKEQSEKEEKTLKNLENLFLKLGGNLEEIEEEKKLNEDDTGSEPETLEVAETQKEEDVVEEPVGVDEETVGHEENVEVDEEREEITEQEEQTTVDAVADAISKQEKDKDKEEVTKDSPIQKRIDLLEKKVSKLLRELNTAGGGAGFIKDLDDVSIAGIANGKILKYNATTSKWEMADDGGGSGSDVDLSAVAQDIVPDADGTRDLGSSTKKWRDLYVSGSSIVLGTTTLAVDGTGNLTVTPAGQSASPVVTQAATTNTFATFAVSGQNSVVADQGADTVTLVGTGDTTITTNSGTDTITIDTTVDTIDGGNF